MQFEEQYKDLKCINGKDFEAQTWSEKFLRLRELKKDDLIQELIDVHSEAFFFMKISILEFIVLSWVMIIFLIKCIFHFLT